ncbi:MAG: zinc metallopeptidase [Candidatus Omnitrophota bacterium]
MLTLYVIAGFSIIPLILWGLWAQVHVRRVFKKYAHEPVKKGMAGAKFAQLMLKEHGINDFKIMTISGDLADHYDPRKKVIRLSKTVAEGSSVASLGVAAHEAAHAIQDNRDDFFLRVRNSMTPMIEKTAYWLLPLLFVGIIFGGMVGSTFFLDVAVLFYFGIMIFYVVTLPMEWNASSRALQFIESKKIATKAELEGVKKVLQAAALTYVIAAALAVAQFLRLFGFSTSRRL